jgi:hypothetical protein
VTVSAGAGGGSVVGVVLGGGTASGGGGAVLGELPHTGAGQLMTLIAVALFLLVAGYFMTAMAHRRHELRPAGASSGDSTPG